MVFYSMHEGNPVITFLEILCQLNKTEQTTQQQYY